MTQARIEQAVGLFQNGQPAEAEAICLSLLQGDPQNPTLLHFLGAIRVRLGRPAEALENYDAALRLKPDFMLLYNRGIALRLLKRADEALSSFEQALSFNPNGVEAWNGRGNALRDLGRSADALASFERALLLAPGAPEILYNRGTALYDLKRYADALASYDLALAKRPDSVEAFVNRGLALRSLKRFDEALQSFDRALQRDPDHLNALNNRGATLHDLQRFAEARTCYEQALRLAPDMPELLNNRAKVLCETGYTAESFADFRRAAALGRDTQIANAEQTDSKIRHDHELRAHIAGIAAPERGERLPGGAIRADNNIAETSEQWRTAKPQIVVIDNFLTAEALEKLRRFCREQDMWHTVYQDGYVGAGPEQGFAAPLLAQIADELRDTYPEIFRKLPLHYLWAFKYDSRLKGINIHADEAVVNVNFWITEDEANLDPAHGGLVVWDVAAPLDWDFDKFNKDHASMRKFLAENNAKSVTIPYRANRAVIFDSDLFHETDVITFKDGYLNRRINVTLLYGRREWGT